MTDRYAHLIDREPHKIVDALVSPSIAGKRVLITGAGGSIGSELAKVAAKYGPQSLVLMDRSEPALFNICRHLTLQGVQGVRPMLADVAIERDAVNAGAARPDVVFHAAAHKHVPLMEEHPAQAVKNNVLGTLNMVRACKGAKSFVLVSSDKAVNPAGIMGQTKRAAELIVLDNPAWSVVRFGNVIGSSGSVLETWQAQVDAGVPITVTDPGMTRYFITVNEAAGLVLQCAGMGGGGFALDMGEPVRIMDIAHRFSEWHDGHSIRVTGIRPGEKVAEEVWYENESLCTTAHPGILRFETDRTSTAEYLEADLTGRACQLDRDAMEFLDTWAPRTIRVTA